MEARLAEAERRPVVSITSSGRMNFALISLPPACDGVRADDIAPHQVRGEFARPPRDPSVALARICRNKG
jgi:hypothetical protein